jgi:predicted transcriptional regulator
MIIKSSLLITLTALSNINITPMIFQKYNNIPYESLYQIESGKNKNTIEYNTMTMEELMKLNNEKLSSSVE